MNSESLIAWTVIHLFVFAAVGVAWMWPRRRVAADGTNSGGVAAAGGRPGIREGASGTRATDPAGHREGDFASASPGDLVPPSGDMIRRAAQAPEIALPPIEALAVRRSLTAGPGFDIRQIDPESVELSADEMLNPLHSIVQLVEKIRDEGDLSANQRRYLGAALAKSRRMISHIEDIDLMMRLQQGTVSMRERSFSLTEKLAKFSDAAGRSMRDRGISVQFRDLDPKPFLVSVDELLLEKLLGQLMNATLRVTDGGGVIEVILSSSEVETAVRGSEFFFLEEDDLAIQEQRKIKIVFSFPQIAGDDRLSYLTHAVAENPETALALKGYGQDDEGGQDLFGLTLARNIARKMGAELVFEPAREGRTEFVLVFEAECLTTDGSGGNPGGVGQYSIQ